MGTKKHKHAELIHKWAEGAEIQYTRGGDTWLDIEEPAWNPAIKYRAKPKALKRVVVARMGRVPPNSTFSMKAEYSNHAGFMFTNTTHEEVSVEVSVMVESEED